MKSRRLSRKRNNRSPHCNAAPPLQSVARFDLETLTVGNLQELVVDPQMRVKLVALHQSLLASRQLIQQVNEQHAMRCRTQIAEFDELIARLDMALGGGAVGP